MKNIEKQLSRAAKYFDYPPTPDIATLTDWKGLGTQSFRVRRRNLAWTIAVLLVVVVSLLSVPSVRAQLIEFLQIGGVRILLPEPTSTGTPPLQTVTPTTSRSFIEQELVVSVLDLDGATTLAEAREIVDFPIQLPNYPASLGEPNHVFVSDVGTGLYVVLAWTAPDESKLAEISLYILGPDVRLTKGLPNVVEETMVNGQPAAFVEGIYLLSIDGFVNPARLVSGPVLVWEEGGLTYRLEADLPQSEMLRIAESLQP